MSYQIELRHLKYFKTLAEELNYRKASERLFIAQPGLSRQIKQMEEILDAQLFERTKRSVKLTPAGTYLKTEVDYLFNRLEFAKKQTSLIHKGDSGEVRIGFVGSAIHHVLPELILRINSQFPDIHTSLQELANLQQIELLLKDKLDLGFVRISSFPKGLQSKVVHEDSFSVVLPAAHPMTAQKFEHIGQLKDEKFILFSSDYSNEYYNMVTSICQDQGFDPVVSHESVHAFTIFKLVENGLGIAIVPTTLIEGYQLRIKAIELVDIPQRTKLSAIWKTDNHNASLQNALDFLFEGQTFL
ncbi:LysR family transcriptional regulator [Flammeovirgaceae bacterium SG7u.111]|nr:LysR family transcriptional regulator [Flammeovirgaceae bacterium SG7u.132]WPO36969.1 LysR family transcriptional regulator [Flammeovirgaceae bacterium SG7u.111]